MKNILILVALFGYGFVPLCWGGDLDDGIAADSIIDDNLQLGKNIQFIKQNALRKAKSGKAIVTGCEGVGNNSFGPGTDLDGATIVNMSNNKNAASFCEKR